MFNENYRIFHRYGDSVIARHNLNLHGSYLSDREVRLRVPQWSEGKDFVMSDCGDLTILGTIENVGPVAGGDSLVPWRTTVIKLLGALPPGFALVKMDGFFASERYEEPTRMSLLCLTLLNRDISKAERKDMHFWGARAGYAKVASNRQKDLCNSVFEGFCKRLEQSGIFRWKRLRGNDIEVAIQMYLTLLGERGERDLLVDDSVTMGGRHMDVIWLTGQGERSDSDVDDDPIKRSAANCTANEVDHSPLIGFIPGCDLMFTQRFCAISTPITDCVWYPADVESGEIRYIDTHYSVMTWASSEVKLHKNMEAIRSQLSERGIWFTNGMHERPWLLTSMFPGLIGELPRKVCYEVDVRPAARYIMRP